MLQPRKGSAATWFLFQSCLILLLRVSLQAFVLGGMQRSIFIKHIMKTKNRPVNAAAGCSGPSHLWLRSFPASLFTGVCVLVQFPNGPFSSRSIHKRLTRWKWAEWHRVWGVGGVSLEPLGSMDALPAPFSFREREAGTVEGGEGDYHGANKNQA